MPTDYRLCTARYAAMMAHEAVGRRLRHADPEPRARRLVLSEADHLLFEAIDRHGPLPSSYLYEFTRHLRRDRTHLQNRLTEFYNGDGHGSYLTRPQQQFASYEARYQHLVYDLAPRARLLVAERRALSSPRSDPFVHRLMTACVSASFELTAGRHGLRYIPVNEILDRPGAASARASTSPLALPIPRADHSALVPDLLFGLEYPRAGFRFFAVECDRNTESIERRNLRQSAFARKLTGYATVLDAQAYRNWWGIPNLHMLTITTNAVHAANILRFIRDQISPSLHPALGITVAPAFGRNWRVPKEPLACLMDMPWQTASGWKEIAKV
jgi:hypothetical protein